MDKKIEEQSLEQLFRERDESYHNCTRAIILKISFVFDAILEALHIDPTVMTWEGIDIHEAMLILIGKIASSPGDTETIRVLTVAIPLEIINCNSKEQVINFLQKNMVLDENNKPSIRELPAPTENNMPDPAIITKPVTRTMAGETALEYIVRNTTGKRTLH